MKEQIDFLLDVYNADPNSDLLLLKAAFEADATEKLITEAISLKFKATAGIPYGFKLLAVLDASFILGALEKLPSSVSDKFSEKY